MKRLQNPLSWTLLIAAIILSPRSSGAAASESGAILLRQPFGARPFALGQAYSALGDDAFGLAYNPATLTRLRESQIATQYMKSVVDTRIGYGAFATPLNPRQALGIGIAYMDAGKADIFDANGASAGSVNAQRDFLAELGYGHAFESKSGRLHVGAAGKLLSSSVADSMKTTAFAGDLGGIFEFPFGAGIGSIGAVAANMGPGVRYRGGTALDSQSDPLPLVGRFALGYTRNLFSSDGVAAGAEAERLIEDGTMSQSVGLEYNYRQIASFRMGYRRGSSLEGVRVGFGIRVKGLSMDYGLGLVQTFSSVQQLSLTYHFAIPGIRYNQALLSPLSFFERNIQSAISGDRLFDAAMEIDRLGSVFPGARVSGHKDQIQAKLQVLHAAGPQSPQYEYALGYEAYQSKDWKEAVLNLEIAARRNPQSEEVRKYLSAAEQNLKEQTERLKLQGQARIGTLYDFASRAFEEGDYSKAKRILTEILRVGPYHPALMLQEKIESLSRRRREASPRRAPKAAVSSPQAPAEPTPEEMAQADDLYYDGIRRYAGNDLEGAKKSLQRALSLNQQREDVRSTLDVIERELKKRRSP